MLIYVLGMITNIALLFQTLRVEDESGFASIEWRTSRPEIAGCSGAILGGVGRWSVGETWSGGTGSGVGLRSRTWGGVLESMVYIVGPLPKNLRFWERWPLINVT